MWEDFPLFMGVFEVKKGDWDIPDCVLESLVRCLLTDVSEFFSSEEGQKCLEEYKRGKTYEEIKTDDIIVSGLLETSLLDEKSSSENAYTKK